MVHLHLRYATLHHKLNAVLWTIYYILQGKIRISRHRNGTDYHGLGTTWKMAYGNVSSQIPTTS